MSVVVAVTLIGWAIQVGPDTAYRVLRYNFTDIDDYLIFPARELKPSPQPFRFPPGRQITLNVPPIGGFDTLDDLAEATESVAWLVVKDDQVVYERYYLGHDASTPSQLFSVSKSIFSIVVGAALADGYFASVEQPITDFVPELKGAGYDTVTIRHLLDMTSGMDYLENDNPFGAHAALNYTPRLEQEVLEFVISEDPGLSWQYRSGETALLGLALDRAIGSMSLTDYFEKRIWGPMGMEDRGAWSIDRAGGLERTWCCLAMSPRDLAKFGRLFLNGGAWDGQHLVPESWVDESTTVDPGHALLMPAVYEEIGIADHHYYWWILDRGDYMAQGHRGQFLYVDPNRSVIVVRQGHRIDDLAFEEWIELFRWISDQADS